MMYQESILQVKRMVWGKIESYPWWPGKIVEIIEQDNLLVYKVSFFGDASYSYLHEQNIIPYEFFDINLNNSFLIDQKLQKAIEHSKRIAEKRHISFRSTDEEISSSKQQITLFSAPHESVNNNSHPQIAQVQHSVQNTDNQQIVIADLMSKPITFDNVIDLIKISTTFLNIEGYCYSNRKEIICFKKQLKDKLLDKYNLSNFQYKECQKKHYKSINKNQIHRSQARNLKKAIYKRQNLKNSDQIKVLLVKKAYKKLKEQGLNHLLSKQKSLQIYNQLIANFGGMTAQLKHRFIQMIRYGNLQSFDKEKQI